MTMTRLPDWPARLAAYLQAMRDVPFAWGANDCATFAAGAVRAVTGRDTLPSGRWATQREAVRMMRSLHGLRTAVGARLPCIPVAYAQRGDILAVCAPRLQLAVLDSDGHWWAPALTGLVRGDMQHALDAWAVGHG